MIALPNMVRPTGGQFAAAALLGILFGALGVGFAVALGLFYLGIGTLALFQILTQLKRIAYALEVGPSVEVASTMPMPTGLYASRCADRGSR